uniref:helix-turn-helix domain-containing protein n=1 Tax=Rhodococcus qingshengii TaxID=334542 RepID=UPI001C4DF43B|nr:helix-turn-helix domain-containing protein [Rhodococcus qingshengii]
MGPDIDTGDLVRRAAQHLLTADIDRLIDASVDRTLAAEPGYTSGPVTRADLRFQMDRTFRLALMRIAGIAIPDTLSRSAFDVGQVRARQGIPLAAVLHSFRIDLKTLWDALNAESRQLDSETRAAFLDRSSSMVWDSVEANTEEVVRGYNVAQGSLDDIRSAAFEQLLIGKADDRAAVHSAARALDLPVTGRYYCLIGAFPIPRPELVDQSERLLEAAGISFFFSWYTEELRALLLVPAGDGIPSDGILSHLDALGVDHVCSVVDAHGLADVPRAISLARTTVAGRAAPGVRHIRRDWIRAVAAGNTEVSAAIHSAVFRPLDALTKYERAAVVEAVGDLVAHGGSIADVAARIYRHRNTVRKRLRDFAELTGFDVARTQDLAITAIAFAVEEKCGSAPPEQK